MRPGGSKIEPLGSKWRPGSLWGAVPPKVDFCTLQKSLKNGPKIAGGASWNFKQYFFSFFSTSSAILDPNIGPIWARNRCRNGAPKGAETEEAVGMRFVLVFSSFCKHVCLEF